MEATWIFFFFNDYGNSSLMLSIRGCAKGHRDTWQTKLPSEIRQQQVSKVPLTPESAMNRWMSIQ